MSNRRGAFAEWGIVGLIVAGVSVCSVTILPLLPPFLVPQAMTIAVVATAIEENAPRAAAIGIWGGLALDLLAPSRFGMLWIPLICLGLLAVLLRGNATNDSPLLWPLWFTVAAILCAAPFVVMVGTTLTAGLLSIAATTVWGIIVVFAIRWVRSSRIGYMRRTFA